MQSMGSLLLYNEDKLGPNPGFPTFSLTDLASLETMQSYGKKSSEEPSKQHSLLANPQCGVVSREALSQNSPSL